MYVIYVQIDNYKNFRKRMSEQFRDFSSVNVSDQLQITIIF